jgi:hypothetical protein
MKMSQVEFTAEAGNLHDEGGAVHEQFCSPFFTQQ